MEKEFITYDLALRLKALGYNEPCLAYFIELKNPCEGILEIIECDKNIDGILAPTWQSAFAWFRDNYGIDSAICKHTGFKSKPYTLDIIKNDNDVICDYDNDEDLKTYQSYPQAQLACLKKLCEIVENNLV